MNENETTPTAPAPVPRKPMTEETKQKIRDSQPRVKKPVSEETKAKISASSKSRSPETLAKFKATIAKKRAEAEARGESLVSEAVKQRLREVQVGRKVTDEVKKQMSESAKKRWAKWRAEK